MKAANRMFTCAIAILVVTLAACAGGAVNTSASTPENEVASEAACQAKLHALESPHMDAGQKSEEKMKGPLLISGDEYPLLSREQSLAIHSTKFLVARCAIRIDGTVSDCAMVCSDPLFDETVLENLRVRRYKPAMFKGRDVEVKYTFKFRIASPP